MASAMLFEEVLLIAYRDEKGNPAPGAGRAIDFSLACAVLAELTVADRIRVERHHPKVFTPLKDTFTVVDRTPLGDQEADTTLQQIAERQHAPVRWWLGEISKSHRYLQYKSMLRQRLLDRLVKNGTLKIHDHKVLGLFSVRRYPTVDSVIEADACARLEQLLNGATPEPRTAILAILLRSAKLLSYGIPGVHVKRLDALDKELRNSRWGTAVQRETFEAVLEGFKSWSRPN